MKSMKRPKGVGELTTFLDRVRHHGKTKYGTWDPKRVLELMYRDDDMKLWEIGEWFGVSRTWVTQTMKDLGIELEGPGRRSQFGRRLCKKGYDTVGAFFRTNSGKTFDAMADELGVNPTTVQKHYDDYVASLINDGILEPVT